MWSVIIMLKGRGREEGEKRFVFMMYFCTGKVTEIFRLEGIVRTH